MPPVLHILIFDDVVAARGETFHIPGLEVTVVAHADDAVGVVRASTSPPDVVFMDFAMGRGRKSGTEAIEELRAAGYAGRIVAISSDPAANAAMRKAGADESLSQKALLRSFLVHLGESASASPEAS
ncbi:MAG TPA: response regulator [Kofleriaceae bacterium]|nr:response regulator [Kofleriaceae bacterium]